MPRHRGLTRTTVPRTGENLCCLAGRGHSLSDMDDIELQPPRVASDKHTGLVLDIDILALHHPLPLAGEDTHAYIRCTDGTTYRLPAALQDWATTVIAAHYAHKAAGKPLIFPGQIEFGILDGTVYAELL